MKIIDSNMFDIVNYEPSPRKNIRPEETNGRVREMSIQINLIVRCNWKFNKHQFVLR